MRYTKRSRLPPGGTESAAAAIRRRQRCDGHEGRLRDIAETPKRLCYDEFHRTSKTKSVRYQIVRDVREGRKRGIQIILASQMLDDFDDDMVDLATGVWILGAAISDHTMAIAFDSDAEGHHISDGIAQIGADIDRRHRHLAMRQIGIVQVVTGDDAREDMAHFLADAQLPLAGAARCAASRLFAMFAAGPVRRTAGLLLSRHLS